jgi:hypothetical protein
MNSASYGSFMYADDLILIAPSVAELQLMVNICCEEFDKINLKLNTHKSCCLRIGKNYHNQCCNISTTYGSLPWVKETKYLGLTITSGSRFKISFTNTKCKFYACFNELYAKLGCILDLSVIVHLLQTMALPILVYSLESLTLKKNEFNSLEFTLRRALFKIFKVTCIDDIKYCMHMYGVDSITDIYNKKRSAFIHKLGAINNLSIEIIQTSVVNHQLSV